MKFLIFGLMSSLKDEAEQICKSLFMLYLRRENLVSVD